MALYIRMEDYERAPCYICRKCPVSKEQWGKGDISIGCDPAVPCEKWNMWFPDGWNTVC